MSLSVFLRVPLLWKLLGANVVLVVAMALLHYALPSTSTQAEVAALLAASMLATAGLGWLALRPVAGLEETARRVSEGDYAARAPKSPLADRDLDRLSTTMNRLLDRVAADRARIHYLAGRSIRARDIERESVARELRESYAQTLSGAALQLTAARTTATDQHIRQSLDEVRDMLTQLTDEMRSVAETLYPGALSEFGLVNAIEALARRVQRRSGIQVEVEVHCVVARLDSRSSAALYRVAEEALRNAEQHARATRVTVRLACDDGPVSIEIDDDGRGIDLRAHDPVHSGLGLFSARAMLALTGGDLQISSGVGLGTRVKAWVPVVAPSPKPTAAAS